MQPTAQKRAELGTSRDRLTVQMSPRVIPQGQCVQCTAKSAKSKFAATNKSQRVRTSYSSSVNSPRRTHGFGQEWHNIMGSPRDGDVPCALGIAKVHLELHLYAAEIRQRGVSPR